MQEYFEFAARIHMRSKKKEIHYHDYWEIYYLVDGACCYFIDNKCFRLSAGDVAMIPPGTIHKANYETPTFSRLLIYCSPAYVPLSACSTLQQFPVLSRSDLTADAIERIFKAIQQEYDYPDAFSSDLIKNKTAELLLLIARGSRSVEQLKNESPIVEMAVKFIRSRYMEAISLGDVAQYCFVSREHLSRIFKRETGFKLSEYLNIYRLQKADALLKEYPKMRISEVAHRCGFNDSNYFSKAYKKMYHISPTTAKNGT